MLHPNAPTRKVYGIQFYLLLYSIVTQKLLHFHHSYCSWGDISTSYHSLCKQDHSLQKLIQLPFSILQHAHMQNFLVVCNKINCLQLITFIFLEYMQGLVNTEHREFLYRPKNLFTAYNKLLAKLSYLPSNFYIQIQPFGSQPSKQAIPTIV